MVEEGDELGKQLSRYLNRYEIEPPKPMDRLEAQYLTRWGYYAEHWDYFLRCIVSLLNQEPNWRQSRRPCLFTFRPCRRVIGRTSLQYLLVCFIALWRHKIGTVETVSSNSRRQTNPPWFRHLLARARTNFAFLRSFKFVHKVMKRVPRIHLLRKSHWMRQRVTESTTHRNADLSLGRCMNLLLSGLKWLYVEQSAPNSSKSCIIPLARGYSKRELGPVAESGSIPGFCYYRKCMYS